MLGQFCMVLSKLDRNWTKALLHRTQFANPRFLQDVLQTLQLISNALGASRAYPADCDRTAYSDCDPADHGQPLPFIYNPLLERFLKPPEVLASGRQLGYGYELQLGDEEFEGLPQHVDFKTISSLDYLRFSSGVSQAYALINVRPSTLHESAQLADVAFTFPSAEVGPSDGAAYSRRGP